MNKNWHGLMKIVEIQHICNGEVVWEEKNILNTFHNGGELFVLSCCFDNGGSLPPANYYLGLDNRSTVSADDMLSDLVDEPTSNGYLRASVSSSNAFVIDTISGVYNASGPIITFTATGSGYGPVSNLFLATTSDNTGILIATAVLSAPITFTNSSSVNMRMRLSLQDGS